MTQSPGRPGTRGWVVGRIRGAPVVLAPSMLVMAALLTVLFAPVVGRFLPDVGSAAALATAGMFAVLLFASVFLHELAHGLMATAFGVPVREYAITLWGGHTQFGAEARTPGTSALVAVVGPLTNIALGAGFWALYLAVPSGVVGLLLLAGAAANGFVGAFNLLPGLPLDGGRILEAGVWRLTGDRARAMSAAGWAGRVVSLALVAVVIGRDVVAGLRPDLLTVAWVALVGAFLWTGASAAVRGAAGVRAVDGLEVSTVAEPAVGVPATESLDVALRAQVSTGARQVVLLAPDGRPAAWVDPQAAASVPPDRTGTTPLASVGVPLPVGAVIRSGLRGQELVRAVADVSRFAPVMAVVDPADGAPGRVVGLLAARDVIAALRHRG